MSESEIEAITAAHALGDSRHKRLFAALYADLRRTAARELRRNGAAAISPTTLLHEAYVSLSGGSAEFVDESHFLAYAARTMRYLIVDHLRTATAQKRGGNYEITSLPTEVPSGFGCDLGIEQLSEALEALAVHHPRLAQCLDLKFFCGFSFGEIARMWQVSERTVQRDWDKARLLLQQFMETERQTQP